MPVAQNSEIVELRVVEVSSGRPLPDTIVCLCCLPTGAVVAPVAEPRRFSRHSTSGELRGFSKLQSGNRFGAGTGLPAGVAMSNGPLSFGIRVDAMACYMIEREFIGLFGGDAYFEPIF